MASKIRQITEFAGLEGMGESGEGRNAFRYKDVRENLHFGGFLSRLFQT